MALTDPPKRERRFIYAADMEAMGERIKRIEGEFDSLRSEYDAIQEFYEQIREADDWKGRFEFLALSVQDYLRGQATTRDLEAMLKRTFEGAEEELSPELRA